MIFTLNVLMLRYMWDNCMGNLGDGLKGYYKVQKRTGAQD